MDAFAEQAARTVRAKLAIKAFAINGAFILIARSFRRGIKRIIRIHQLAFTCIAVTGFIIVAASIGVAMDAVT